MYNRNTNRNRKHWVNSPTDAMSAQSKQSLSIYWFITSLNPFPFQIEKWLTTQCKGKRLQLTLAAGICACLKRNTIIADKFIRDYAPL